MEKEESKRLHLDWWGKCRTCKFWHGADSERSPRWFDAPCENPKSEFYGEETHTECYCSKWDSFDIETAFELMDEWEERKKNNYITPKVPGPGPAGPVGNG